MISDRLTDEQLAEILSGVIEGVEPTTQEVAMAAELQERRKVDGSQSVGWTDAEELRSVEKDGCGYLFTVNPITPNADPRRVIKLYTAPPASERERIRREHAEWSDKTFGDVGPIGSLKHLSKEALEAAAAPSDPLEWADMQFLLWDAQRRMGISDEFVTRAMIEKLAINKARQWPEPKDCEPRLHIKEQPVPAASSESVSQSLTDALRDVIAERQRQVSVKGWTAEHDDTYTCGELSGAAISYIEPMEAVFYWPAEWHDDSFKPSDERRNLVKATALLLAEIERLDRISAASALSEVSDGKARED
ncbi:hypothetical protein CB204_17795 [Salmonella enterica subsp. enterica serovar Stanley]|nr:hypothetical protein [Salmonella enterica subsp. enterica serovar Stanley]EDH9123047.1 hypothetical protein [Salmonella enterica subsp. enterica serovar Stanley]